MSAPAPVDDAPSRDRSDGPVVVVVGNPSPASRTLTAATLVADRLAALSTPTPRPHDVIDLAEHGPSLLGWQSPESEALKRRVLAGAGLVVATPTYKASYTGLLKLFLDAFGKDELAGLPTIGLMTGGSPAHSLAVEVHLAPVLVEIGASLPTRGLYLAGPQVDEPGPAIEAWWATARAPLGRAVAVAPGPAPAGT